MNVHCVGCNSVYGNDYSVCRKAERGEYMLILTKNSALFRLNGSTVKVPPETLILYNDRCVREYSSDGGFFVCDWVCFDADNDSEFIDSLELNFNQPVKFSDFEFISSLLRNIATEYYSLSGRRIKMIDSLMKIMLVKVSECTDRTDRFEMAVDPHYSALAELREKIYRNPQMKWNVDAMANDVNMSRSYFQHVYREMFGVSCISDVISGKIEKAKEILSETSCTVSQVSSMCGYDNEEHFMRQFKKIVGVTPTKYRKNNKLLFVRPRV